MTLHYANEYVRNFVTKLADANDADELQAITAGLVDKDFTNWIALYNGCNLELIIDRDEFVKVLLTALLRCMHESKSKVPFMNYVVNGLQENVHIHARKQGSE